MDFQRIAMRILLIAALGLGVLAALTVLGSANEWWAKVILLALLAGPVILYYFRLWPTLQLLGLLGLSVLLIVFINWAAVFAAIDSVIQYIIDPNRLDPNSVIVCRESNDCTTVHAFVYSAIFLLVFITGFAYTTLLERKFIAFFQQRVGPNRVGPDGFLQPLADAIKLITKEDITPVGAYHLVWFLAPMLKALPTLLVVAVIPLGPDIIVPWFDGRFYQVPLGLADPSVGVLWLLAVTSVATYGVVLAGWSSNNKYAMLGGMRASAQMISYELSLGLAIVVPVMLAGSMSVGDIIDAQGTVPILGWFVFQNPLAAGILLVALIAEVNRAPFDLPEAEQELTAGYMTEYSGMKFAAFMMAEYLGMIGVSAIAASLFFGGYHFILVDELPILGPLVMIAKIVVFLIGMVWVRATLPRIRYDRLMSFGWKVLLPLSLVAVAWTGISVVLGEVFPSEVYILISGLLFVIVVGGGILVLRRMGEEESPDDLADDPAVSGERHGLGWAILEVLGGLIGGLFAIVDAIIWVLELGRKMGQGPGEAGGSAEAETSTTQTSSSAD